MEDDTPFQEFNIPEGLTEEQQLRIVELELSPRIEFTENDKLLLPGLHDCAANGNKPIFSLMKEEWDRCLCIEKENYNCTIT